MVLWGISFLSKVFLYVYLRNRPKSNVLSFMHKKTANTRKLTVFKFFKIILCFAGIGRIKIGCRMVIFFLNTFRLVFHGFPNLITCGKTRHHII